MRTAAAIVLPILVGSTVCGFAQTDRSGHSAMMDHGAQMQDGTTSGAAVLTEPGQGAFAALSEVVKVLEADPDTDWTKVDLTGLRAHLVDMDRLVTDAVVTETALPDGIRTLASGDAATLGSIHRMVPAHATELAKDDRWTVAVADKGNGVELTVTSDDPGVATRIRGLGFFGLMASQDHHREHHLMMARGEGSHHP